eukprot:7053569-Karenia_brevis.AAC.1
MWCKAAVSALRDVLALGAEVWKSDKPLEERGLKIVGTLIGTPEYINRVGRDIVASEARLLDYIPKMPSLQ